MQALVKHIGIMICERSADWNGAGFVSLHNMGNHVDSRFRRPVTIGDPRAFEPLRQFRGEFPFELFSAEDDVFEMRCLGPGNTKGGKNGRIEAYQIRFRTADLFPESRGRSADGIVDDDDCRAMDQGQQDLHDGRIECGRDIKWDSEFRHDAEFLPVCE